MAAMERGEKRRWTTAMIGSIIVGAVAVAIIRAPRVTTQGERVTEAKRAVTLVPPGESAVNDEAMLLDPTPLFLPTRWNATQRAVIPPEGGGRFQGFDAPRYSFSESELKLGLPVAVAVPTGAADAVAIEGPAVALVGLGHSDRPLDVPLARGAFVEIAAAGTGRRVLHQEISEVVPKAGTWQPMEFIAGVDSAGLLGPLVISVRSGLEEVDGYFTNYLVRTLRVGERLAPGFYRIRVGP